MPYSLSDTVQDGPITAPRWLHHAVKVLCGLGAFVGYLCLHLAPVTAGIAGAVTVEAIAFIVDRINPDPEPLTIWQHIADWLTDGACAAVAILAGVVIAHGVTVTAAYLAVSLVTVYAFCHHDARP